MNRFIQYVTISITVLFASTVLAEKQPQTEQEKLSYAVGIQISTNLMREGIPLEQESFIQAVRDALNGNEMKLSVEEMQQVLISYQQQQNQQKDQQAAVNKAAGEKFLADNKSKEGVIELASGLQYKVINKGDGEIPAEGDSVLVNYEGTLINGDVFDSSYERGEPITLQVDRVIQGWQQALRMMPVGSKWQLFIPSELAYGENGAGSVIGPNATLIFDIELLSIQ